MEPAAIDIGIPETEYWSMTFGEIMKQVESHQRLEKRRLQEKAYFAYKEAYLNSYAVNDPSGTPKFEDVFEFVKDDEVKAKQIEDAENEPTYTQAPAWKVKQVEMMQMSVRAKVKKQMEALENKVENGGES